nr:beta-3-deoxy-D-manno-oct-2-ulosonic acid transferase [Novosphingobium sp. CF614]
MSEAVPILRSPPFPGGGAVSFTGPSQSARADPDGEATTRLFAAIRAARVGGPFWAAPPRPLPQPAVLLRPRTLDEIPSLLARLDATERAASLWLLAAGTSDRAARRALGRGGGWHAGDVDPWPVLDGALRLLAHGDDEWAALARIAGVPVTLLSAGRFGAPGTAPATLDLLAARAVIGADYRDPFTGAPAAIESAIAQLADWRRILDANRPLVAACGMSWWKRAEISRFLWSPHHPLRITMFPARALALARRKGGAVAVWPSRVSAATLRAAKARGVPLVRVEDGFVRSVGLGSNLVPPSSIVVDRLGIHYDPSRPSDLERLLADAPFPPELLARARTLRAAILRAGISKYGAGSDPAPATRGHGRRLVLVPAQVEDDMSVRLGGGGLASNLELLRRVRALEPDAEIWFRPHPDVDAGHRKGAVRDADALRLADRIVRGGGMAGLLDQVDAVHVLTSLTGFEALLRGRAVTCHGTPFYAGWGLTRDLGAVPDRRTRVLTLDELVAGVLILYPRYLDPVTRLPCPPEVLVRRMAEDRAPNRLGWATRLRQWQGRLMAQRA